MKIHDYLNGCDVYYNNDLMTISRFNEVDDVILFTLNYRHTVLIHEVLFLHEIISEIKNDKKNKHLYNSLIEHYPEYLI